MPPGFSDSDGVLGTFRQGGGSRPTHVGVAGTRPGTGRGARLLMTLIHATFRSAAGPAADFPRSSPPRPVFLAPPAPRLSRRTALYQPRFDVRGSWWGGKGRLTKRDGHLAPNGRG